MFSEKSEFTDTNLYVKEKSAFFFYQMVVFQTSPSENHANRHLFIISIKEAILFSNTMPAN